jgi:hypothetical protein
VVAVRDVYFVAFFDGNFGGDCVTCVGERYGAAVGGVVEVVGEGTECLLLLAFLI